MINAATSIYAFNAGAISPGTAIIEGPCDRRTALTLDSPPGNFSPPPAVVQPAAAANDARSIEPTAAQFCAAPPWECWSQVPRDPDLIRDLGPWCLEIFSGSAGLSSQRRLHGLQILPPIDVTRSDTVQEPTDIFDAEFFSFVLLLCRMGAVAFLHLGTPCSSFSLARWRPGGRPDPRIAH